MQLLPDNFETKNFLLVHSGSLCNSSLALAQMHYCRQAPLEDLRHAGIARETSCCFFLAVIHPILKDRKFIFLKD